MRFLIRPFAIPIIDKLGLKKSLIIGTILYAGLFLVLYNIHHIGLWLWILIAYHAISDIAYFLPMHSFYAAAGDHDDRGRKMAMREVLALSFGTAAPIIAGIVAAKFGFGVLYILATLLMLLAVVPLFFTDNFNGNQPMSFSEAWRSIDFRGFGMMLGDGIKVQAEFFVWAIYIFFVTANLIHFGWLLGLNTFLLAVLYLVLGKMFDEGRGKSIWLIGAIGLSIMFFVRAFFIKSVDGIILSQILLAFALVFYDGAFSSVLYNLAKQTKNTLWFHFYGEEGADVGAMILYFSTAFFVHLGVQIQYMLLLGILGMIIIRPILNSYFSE